MGMSAQPPRSFGRAADRSDDPVLVFPPVQLTSVQLPLELVADPDSLMRLGAQIQEMVRSSVLAGLDEAMEQAEQAGESVLAGDRPEVSGAVVP